MNKWDEPFLTTCDLCSVRMAAVPGPRWRRGRPLPPPGFRVGYITELADREFPICARCLANVLQTAA